APAPDSSVGAEVTRTLAANVSPPSVEREKNTLVATCVGSTRVSYQLRLTEPSTGSTDSHWKNWSFATPVGSSFTMTGAPQVAPPSVERDTKTSNPFPPF